MGEIVVYDLGIRDEVDPTTIINYHIDHAKQNDNKVLFTVPSENSTKIGKGHNDIREIIVTNSEGSCAFIGDLVGKTAFGVFNVSNYRPTSDFTSPPQFDINAEMRRQHTWFAVSNLRLISKEELENYRNINTQKTLLHSISGASCRIYVEREN